MGKQKPVTDCQIAGARAQLVTDNQFLKGLRTQRKIHLDEIRVQEGHVSILDAKVDNWERWVLYEGKEVVCFVRQKPETSERALSPHGDHTEGHPPSRTGHSQPTQGTTTGTCPGTGPTTTTGSIQLGRVRCRRQGLAAGEVGRTATGGHRTGKTRGWNKWWEEDRKRYRHDGH